MDREVSRSIVIWLSGPDLRRADTPAGVRSLKKDTEIDVQPRHPDRVTPADRRKEEEPPDDQEDEYNNERRQRYLGSVLFHTVRSWLQV